MPRKILICDKCGSDRLDDNSWCYSCSNSCDAKQVLMYSEEEYSKLKTELFNQNTALGKQLELTQKDYNDLREENKELKDKLERIYKVISVFCHGGGPHRRLSQLERLSFL